VKEQTPRGEVSVIVPALNEEAAVGIVTQQLLRDGPYEAIVVDNGSKDRTAQVAAEAGARVVSEPRRGYGAACLAGARAATTQILVFMDADGSFLSSEIPSLVKPLEQGRADLVLGTRVLSSGVRQAVLPHQHLGNWLACQMLRLCCGLHVTDLGPFRAIRREALFRLQMSEMTYGWPIEMMVKAQRQHLRVVEVPVTYGPRLGGRSKVSGTVKGSVMAGYHILRVILRHSIQRRQGRDPDVKDVPADGQ
jgi:glycosyltransferase involved in cell wall biosynthesis